MMPEIRCISALELNKLLTLLLFEAVCNRLKLLIDNDLVPVGLTVFPSGKLYHPEPEVRIWLVTTPGFLAASRVMTLPTGPSTRTNTGLEEFPFVSAQMITLFVVLGSDKDFSEKSGAICSTISAVAVLTKIVVSVKLLAIRIERTRLSLPLTILLL